MDGTHMCVWRPNIPPQSSSPSAQNCEHIADAGASAFDGRKMRLQKRTKHRSEINIIYVYVYPTILGIFRPCFSCATHACA